MDIMINYVTEHMDAILNFVLGILFGGSIGLLVFYFWDITKAKIDSRIEAKMDTRIQKIFYEQNRRSTDLKLENIKEDKSMFLTTSFLLDEHVQIASDTHIMSLSTLFAIPISHN